jgi:hypothetical protein
MIQAYKNVDDDSQRFLRIRFNKRASDSAEQQKPLATFDKGKSRRVMQTPRSPVYFRRTELCRFPPANGMTKLSKVQTSTILTLLSELFFRVFFRQRIFALCIGSALFPNRKCFDCYAGRVTERACLVLSVCGRRQMSSGEQKEDIN